MERLNIAQCLAEKHNEDLLRIMFCCEFDENRCDADDEDGVGYFVRLHFDCRTGQLGTTVSSTQESARKQLYHYHGEDSLHFIPLVSAWIHGDAPAYYHWGETDLYPIKRMESAGWTQWRKDAEAYITKEYAKHTKEGYFS